MNKFASMLLALKMYIKQYHWLSKGYENHILADKLEESLDEYIDEAAELFVLRGKYLDDISGLNILVDAKQFIGGYYIGQDMNNMLRDIVSIIKEILILAQSFGVEEEILKDGYGDYISRLSNLLLKKLYLLDVQLKKYEDIQ